MSSKTVSPSITATVFVRLLLTVLVVLVEVVLSSISVSSGRGTEIDTKIIHFKKYPILTLNRASVIGVTKAHLRWVEIEVRLGRTNGDRFLYRSQLGSRYVGVGEIGARIVEHVAVAERKLTQCAIAGCILPSYPLTLDMIYDVIFEVAGIRRGHHYLANLILELDVRVAVTQVFVEHPGEVDVGPFRELDVEADCLILSRPELSFVHSRRLDLDKDREL